MASTTTQSARWQEPLRDRRAEKHVSYRWSRPRAREAADRVLPPTESSGNDPTEPGGGETAASAGGWQLSLAAMIRLSLAGAGWDRIEYAREGTKPKDMVLTA